MFRKFLTGALLVASFATLGTTINASTRLEPQTQQTRSGNTNQQSRLQPAGPTRQTAISGATRTQVLLANEIGHRLASLPYYGVFDWLTGQVQPDGSVQLRGQVVRPTTKSDAEAAARDVDGVTRVDNQIEVLPLSPSDDRIRIAVYRSIFNYDSPLFTRYAVRAVPPIHIIVRNGNVTLKGIVANKTDAQLANTYTNTVPGVFSVTNELRVENDSGR